jgi:hypothetical protein
MGFVTKNYQPIPLGRHLVIANLDGRANPLYGRVQN